MRNFMNKLIVMSCVCLSLCVPLYAMESKTQSNRFLGCLKRPFVAAQNLFGEYEKGPNIGGLTVAQGLKRCIDARKRHDEFWAGRAWISLIGGCIGLYVAQKARGFDIWTPCTGFRGTVRGYLGIAFGFCLGCYCVQQIINKLTKHKRAEENKNILEVFEDVIALHEGRENSALRERERHALSEYKYLKPDACVTKNLVEQEATCYIFSGGLDLGGGPFDERKRILGPLINKLAEEEHELASHEAR